MTVSWQGDFLRGDVVGPEGFAVWVINPYFID